MDNFKLIRVFVDSDVIISSLISQSGAAFALLYFEEQADLYISNFSVSELNKVVNRLHLDRESLKDVIDSQFTTVTISLGDKLVKTQFAGYVRDPDDAHVVAGAKEANASFLVSYNIRDFDTEKIREDLHITLMTPGLFMQYLRSLPS